MADLTPVTLRDPTSGLSAVYVPAAGMIATSLSDGDTELLGQRRGLEAYLSAGKTMGIPLLYPWANRLSAKTYVVDGETTTLRQDAYGVRPDSNGLPIHGLLAAYPGWRAVQVSDQKLTAELDFGAQKELLESFPFPASCRVDHRTVRPHPDGHHHRHTDGGQGGAAGVRISPYLQLPDVPRPQWQIEMPTMRHLILDDTGIPTGATAERPATAEPLDDTVCRRWLR